MFKYKIKNIPIYQFLCICLFFFLVDAIFKYVRYCHAPKSNALFFFAIKSEIIEYWV